MSKTYANGFLQKLATYATLSMHHSFSFSTVRPAQRHGMLAFWHTAQHTSYGSSFGSAGHLWYWPHSRIMSFRSPSQPSPDMTIAIAMRMQHMHMRLAMAMVFVSPPSLSIHMLQWKLLWVLCEYVGCRICLGWLGFYSHIYRNMIVE
jgi:hypothetical protein